MAKEQWKLIIGLVAVILIVVFALQNINAVAIQLFIFQIQVPLVLVIVLSVLLGVILGLVASYSNFSMNRTNVKALQHQVEQLTEEKLSLIAKQAELDESLGASQQGAASPQE